ncbi:hypothetical protein [Tabrizicola sp. YIM 78059]|uniref:hypothetical protein n=1 Tax=Tabrizicola sp. YIM 78059 TaxID=2529861 RepID=UPI0010AA6064|nr:hypothetical protein [Tabrizicola sp. YIM 78059]
MNRLARSLTLAALLATPALAQDAPVLAELWANNGSLPPEFAWETGVTIHDNGQLTLRHCRGYETDGPACKTRKAKVGADALEAIRAAAKTSGLHDKPARPPEVVMVGGAMTGGLVWLDGQRIDLPAEVHEDDLDRVSGVMRAIRAAIPDRFDRFLDD